MNNILKYTLGIDTADFLSKIGFASSEVLSFAAIGETVGKAWDKTLERV